jgi:drug/metabolite transporter (DMT)-like permease
MTWLLVAVIVSATTIGDVLKAKGMREHGEIHEFGLGALGRAFAVVARNKLIIASVACMAVSFFSFMALVSIADLSFAVPATAVTYVLETILARYLLKEHISRTRWAGAYLVACGVALLVR